MLHASLGAASVQGQSDRMHVSALLMGLLLASSVLAGEEALVTVADVEIGRPTQVTLTDGQTVTILARNVTVSRDAVMNAIRQAVVDVEINGQKARIVSGQYRLPQLVGGVQVDCPVVAAYLKDSHIDHWALEKEVRIRLWPAKSPWVRPGSFVYPVDQRWFASQTWFSNEAVSQRPSGQFYYHAGLDLGASEMQTTVLAATDGTIVGIGDLTLPNLPAEAIVKRYDVVYLRDKRGWYYRYSHLDSIRTGIRLGESIDAGDPIGKVGKEGNSGGWSHLHFEIKSLQPSGRWGTQDGYAFLWQAYRAQYDPPVLAVARPRYLLRVDEVATLDGTRSWARNGIRSFRWLLSDDTESRDSTVERIYKKPGTYSEILRITDADGNEDVDFATVKVVGDDSQPVPGIHATYHPSVGLRAGDPVTFKVRARYTRVGHDVWNFGDGTPLVTVTSNRNESPHARDAYVATIHRYERPGNYVVQVHRETPAGRAVQHLYVRVDGMTPR